MNLEHWDKGLRLVQTRKCTHFNNWDELLGSRWAVLLALSGWALACHFCPHFSLRRTRRQVSSSRRDSVSRLRRDAGMHGRTVGGRYTRVARSLSYRPRSRLSCVGVSTCSASGGQVAHHHEHDVPRTNSRRWLTFQDPAKSRTSYISIDLHRSP